METSALEITSEGIAVVRPWPARPVLLVSLLALVTTTWRVFSTTASEPIFGWVAIASLVAAVASAGALIQRRLDPTVAAPPSRRRSGAISIAGGTLTLTTRAGRWSYPCTSIAEGWVERLTRNASVVLSLATGEVVTIEARDADEANRILVAAGVSADKQVMKSRLAPVLSRHPAAGCLVIPFSIVAASGWLLAVFVLVTNANNVIFHNRAWDDTPMGPSLLMFALFSVGFGAIVVGLLPPQIVIGNDGVTLRGALRRRFVPYERVAQVRQQGNAVELVLRGGGFERLVVEDRFVPPGAKVNPVQQAIFDRIWDAMQMAAQGNEAAPLGALDRAGRPLAAWRDHLIALGQGRSEYRRIALSREDIAAVLADVRAPRERRVAAALALSHTDDDAMKARLREAARACADEELAAALEAAAEDELSEDKLAAALKAER
jgi:hypothetical protein